MRFFDFLKTPNKKIVYQHSEFTNNHLEFACLMLGKRKKYSPRWWFFMVVYNGIKSINNSPTKQTQVMGCFETFFSLVWGPCCKLSHVHGQLMVQKSQGQPLGMYRNPVNNRVNYHITWCGIYSTNSIFFPGHPTVCPKSLSTNSMSNKKNGQTCQRHPVCLQSRAPCIELCFINSFLSCCNWWS